LSEGKQGGTQRSEPGERFTDRKEGRRACTAVIQKFKSWDSLKDGIGKGCLKGNAWLVQRLVRERRGPEPESEREKKSHGLIVLVRSLPMKARREKIRKSMQGQEEVGYGESKGN